MRIVMFDNGAPFCADWARAARMVADVIQVRAVPWQRGNRTQPGSRSGLEVDVPMPGGRCVSAARRLGLDLQARAWASAVREVQREHGRVDLLHAHFYADARPLPAVAQVLGLPFVVTEHSSAFNGDNPDNVLSSRGLQIAKSVYASAAAVLPVSQALSRRIASLGLPGVHVVLPNPVDTTLFKPVSDADGSNLGPPPALRVVNVARLARAKRQDVLLEAFRHVVDTRPDAQLTIIGGGPLEETLRARSVRLGLARHVSFTGHADRLAIATALQSSDVFALSSDTENLPVAVAEALCVGLPVVATQVGGLTEQVGSDDGELVPPREPSEMAAAILRQSGDSHRQRLERAARGAARFSDRAVAERLDDVYGIVLSRQPKRVAP